MEPLDPLPGEAGEATALYARSRGVFPRTPAAREHPLRALPGVNRFHNRLKRGLRVVLLLGLAFAFAAPAAPPDDGGRVRVAVLLLLPSHLTLEERQYLTELIRKSAERLDRSRYRNMDREAIELLVPPDDFRECNDDHCVFRVLEILNARYGVRGEVLQFTDELRAVLVLYDRESKDRLFTEKARAADVAALERAIPPAADRLFDRLNGFGAPPGPPQLEPTPVPRPEPMRVAPPEPTPVAPPAPIPVPPASEVGWLTVTSTPAGQDVWIDGRSTGKTPLVQLRIAAGSHRVEAGSDCWTRASDIVQVTRGSPATKDFRLSPRTGQVEIVADNTCGKAVTAEVWVNGQRLGDRLTPGVFEVPLCDAKLELRQTAHEPLRPVLQREGAGFKPVQRTMKQRVSCEVDWVALPGGTFKMGSESGDSDEKPVHEVTIQPFLMSRTEVTVAQYRRCVEAKACTPPDEGSRWGTCNWGFKDREDHPVNCVDWEQARAYAKWVGGRLPTESEWEYTARSGGKDWTYPWGNEPATCERAVMDQGGNGCGKGNTTWPVCSKPGGNTRLDGRPADGQLCDMAGNVWEWVEDCRHDSYTGAPSDGSAWITSCGSARVLRGGSWFNPAGGLRAAGRNGYGSGGRGADVGFRVVVPAPRS